MKRSTWFISGLITGAIGALILDPVRGHRRRALIRDKFVRWGRNSEDYTIKTAQDLRNRAEGLWHELSSPPNPDVDDQTLLSRVRSSFGRKTRHARSIQTIIENGVVTLRGDILSDEVEDVVQCIKSVAGVKRVINLLTVHQKAENIPNLQGEGPEYLQ